MLRLSPTPDQDAKRWKNKNYIKLQRSPRVIIFNLVRWLLSNAIPPCNLISVKVRQHFLYQTLGRRRHNSPFNPRQIRRRSSTFFSVLTHPKVPGVFFIFFFYFQRVANLLHICGLVPRCSRQLLLLNIAVQHSCGKHVGCTGCVSALRSVFLSRANSELEKKWWCDLFKNKKKGWCKNALLIFVIFI